MIFKSLKDKCYYYRDLADHKLTPNGYYIIMVDGRRFSKNIKKKFERPFDNRFIDIMNNTAKYLCENVQEVQYAFVQSDEISLFCKDNFESEMPWSGRLCKINSLVASMATAFFNREMLKLNPSDKTLYQFDCKVWNVPNENEWRAWRLFRENDCKRNSINQFADYYMSHKEMQNLNTDDLITVLKEKYNAKWNELPNAQKYGRIVQKETIIVNDTERSKWIVTENAPNYFTNSLKSY